MKSKQYLELQNQLKQFHGSEKFYYYPLVGKKLVYTEGMHYVAHEVGAMWLIELIGFEILPKLLKAHKSWFYTLDLIVKPNNAAMLKVTDGNDKTLLTRDINYSDFPSTGDDGFRLFLCETTSAEVDEAYCLMIPSEY